jgi:hypothetical protein
VAPVDPASLPYRPKSGPVQKAAAVPGLKRFDIIASLKRKPTWALKTGSVRPAPPPPKPAPAVVAPKPPPMPKSGTKAPPGNAGRRTSEAPVPARLPAKQAAAAAASAAARQRTLVAARGVGARR